MSIFASFLATSYYGKEWFSCETRWHYVDHWSVGCFAYATHRRFTALNIWFGWGLYFCCSVDYWYKPHNVNHQKSTSQTTEFELNNDTFFFFSKPKRHSHRHLFFQKKKVKIGNLPTQQTIYVAANEVTLQRPRYVIESHFAHH